MYDDEYYDDEYIPQPPPIVDYNVGRTSPVLDQFGNPFSVRQYQQPIGFILKKRQVTNG